MRITKGMLNMTRRRASLQEKGSSLLNYVGQKGGAGARLKAMDATNVRTARLEGISYNRLEKSADGLTKVVSALTAKADDGSGDISGAVASMVEKYNETLKNLKNTTGVLNHFYWQSMREVAQTNQGGLAEIGIAVASDGSLSLDKGKLAGADAEKVKGLLGSKGDFAQRAGYLSSRVADNARANAASTNSRYNSRGSVADSYLSKFNFRG